MTLVATTTKTSGCCSSDKSSGGTCGSSGSGGASGGCCQSSNSSNSTGTCTSTTDASAAASSHDSQAPRANKKAPKSRGATRALCPKCRASPVQVRLHNQVFVCGACFTSHFSTRSKAALRTRCHLAKGSRVLVAVSGGSASSCLARVVAEASDPSSAKRLFFDFDLLHIDDSVLALDSTPSRDEAFEAEVRDVYAEYRVRFLTVPLEEVLNIGTQNEAAPVPLPDLPIGASSSAAAAAASSATSSTTPAAATPAYSLVSIPSASRDSNRVALQGLFRGLGDSSDKADLLTLLRLRLLAHTARMHGYEQVLLGDTATRTAIDIFTETSKGRGALVPLLAASTESRFQATLVYPSRDQSNAAVALFNHFSGVRSVVRPSFVTSKKTAQTGAIGINRITHEFLCGLDARFGTTVPNIIASAAKLATPSATNHQRVTHDSHCALCSRVRIVDDAATHARAKHANVIAASAATASSNAASDRTDANKAVLEDIAACYACSALLREIGGSGTERTSCARVAIERSSSFTHLLSYFVFPLLPCSDLSHLPTYIRLGASADHRDATSGESTYPVASQALNLIPSALLSHAQRAELNAKKKQERGVDDAAGEEHERTRQKSHGLQKQSREDMRSVQHKHQARARVA